MRRPARLAAVLSALVVGAGALTSCAEEGDDYCELLGTEQKRLERLADQADEPGVDVLTPSLEALERLRAESPPELVDEWDTVVAAWAALAEAVEEAGVDAGEYRPGELPEGLEPSEARRLGAVASKLGAPRVTEAADGIEDHAAQVCDVDFRA